MEYVNNDTGRAQKARLTLLAVLKQHPLARCAVLVKVGDVQGRHFFRFIVSILRLPDRRHHVVELADVHGRGGRRWRGCHREDLLLLVQGKRLENFVYVVLIWTNCFRADLRSLFSLCFFTRCAFAVYVSCLHMCVRRPV